MLCRKVSLSTNFQLNPAWLPATFPARLPATFLAQGWQIQSLGDWSPQISQALPSRLQVLQRTLRSPKSSEFKKMDNIQLTNSSILLSVHRFLMLTWLSLPCKSGKFTEIHVITQMQKEWENSDSSCLLVFLSGKESFLNTDTVF